MSDPSWPVDVPSEPESNDYRETLLPNVASFKPDVGPPTAWRRSTLDGGSIQASFVLTYAQRDSFKTFYRTTLKDGTLPFLWTNPAYGVSGRYLFDPENPPQFQSIGAALWRVGTAIIKLA